MIALLSRTLHISQVFLRAVFINAILGHLSLIYEVGFVSYQEEDGIFLCICLYFVHPKLAYVFEAERVSEIKYQEYALTASVVCTGYGSESLLPSSIPNLKFYIFSIHLDSFKSEVDSNGGEVMLRELILYKSNEDGRFSHS